MLPIMVRRCACSQAATRARVPMLSRLSLAESSEAFERSGFTVRDGNLNIGGVGIKLGIQHTSWAFEGASSNGSFTMDGIDTTCEAFDVMNQTLDYQRSPAHANGALALYSVLITTPDLQRTTEALQSVMGSALRVVNSSPFSKQLSMAFFKAGSPLGDVILEVVAPRTPCAEVDLPGLPSIGGDPTAPARIAGIVVTVPSVGPALSAALGSAMGKPRSAIQGQGRKIAPLRHDTVGMGMTMAFISPPDQNLLRQKANSGGKGLGAHLGTGN